MKKIIDERNEYIIRRINQGATWEDMEEEFGLTTTYLRACLKRYLKDDEKRYQILLGIARANSNVRYIDVAETGALLNNSEAFENKKRVYVPSFCKCEIEKLGLGSDMINNPKMCWVNIHWDHINISPAKRVKPRTIGITAFCCTMARHNKESIVRMHTNSKDIVDLIIAQNIPNIKIIKY